MTAAGHDDATCAQKKRRSEAFYGTTVGTVLVEVDENAVAPLCELSHTLFIPDAIFARGAEKASKTRARMNSPPWGSSGRGAFFLFTSLLLQRHAHIEPSAGRHGSCHAHPNWFRKLGP